LLFLEDGGVNFLPKVGKLPPDYTDGGILKRKIILQALPPRRMPQPYVFSKE
jgi:hypothetical protein